MPWLKKLKADQHRCFPPEPYTLDGAVRGKEKYLAGSRWQCRKCSTVWVLVQPADLLMDMYWRKETHND